MARTLSGFTERLGTVLISYVDPWVTVMEEFFKPYQYEPDVKEDYCDEPPGYKIEIDMPGVKREQVDIELCGEALSVNVTRYSTPRLYYQDEFDIEDFDLENITAKLSDGVMTIFIPEKPEDKSKKSVKITVGE